MLRRRFGGSRSSRGSRRGASASALAAPASPGDVPALAPVAAQAGNRPAPETAESASEAGEAAAASLELHTFGLGAGPAPRGTSEAVARAEWDRALQRQLLEAQALQQQHFLVSKDQDHQSYNATESRNGNAEDGEVCQRVWCRGWCHLAVVHLMRLAAIIWRLTFTQEPIIPSAY